MELLWRISRYNSGVDLGRIYGKIWRSSVRTHSKRKSPEIKPALYDLYRPGGQCTYIIYWISKLSGNLYWQSDFLAHTEFYDSRKPRYHWNRGPPWDSEVQFALRNQLPWKPVTNNARTEKYIRYELNYECEALYNEEFRGLCSHLTLLSCFTERGYKHLRQRTYTKYSKSAIYSDVHNTVPLHDDDDRVRTCIKPNLERVQLDYLSFLRFTIAGETCSAHGRKKCNYFFLLRILKEAPTCGSYERIHLKFIYINGL
jgi:hypothetical protein